MLLLPRRIVSGERSTLAVLELEADSSPLKVLCLQHIRNGREVLHLKGLGVDITTERVELFFAQAGADSTKDACLGTTKRTEKRQQAAALQIRSGSRGCRSLRQVIL